MVLKGTHGISIFNQYDNNILSMDTTNVWSSKYACIVSNLTISNHDNISLNEMNDLKLQVLLIVMS